MTDLDSVRDFLAAPRCAVLATLDASGAPHQTVVHYFLEDDHLVVNGRPDRLWAKNLRSNPCVSVVVHDSDDYLHWVGIKGTAFVLHEGQEAVQAAMDLARRYDEDPEEFRNLERVSFAIAPRRVFESQD
jgi:PPOX class probable F420-dependent enzyme